MSESKQQAAVIKLDPNITAVILLFFMPFSVIMSLYFLDRFKDFSLSGFIIVLTLFLLNTFMLWVHVKAVDKLGVSNGNS